MSEKVYPIANKTTVRPDLDKNLFVLGEINEEDSEHLASEPYSYWKAVFRAFIKKPSAIIGLITLGIFILLTIIVPFFAPEEGYQTHVTDAQFEASGFKYMMDLAPSSELLFGCDRIGRDLFFCCWKGAGLSLLLAISAAVIVLFLGTLVGLIWGYFRKLDRIFIEIYNVISNIPSLLLYMLLAIVIRESAPGIPLEVRLIISLSILGWVGLALFIRNQTLIISNREYNVASKTLGTPAFRIMSKNYLPYLLAVIITEASLLIPGMVSSEVTMSYFGLGLGKSDVSLGALLNLGIAKFDQCPWQLLFPAFLLAWIIFSFYLIGMALSDALDPKTHR